MSPATAPSPRRRLIPWTAGPPPSAERSRRFRRRTVVLTVGMISATLLLGATFGERGLLEHLRYRRAHQQLTEEIAALEAEIGALEAEIEALETDPRASERIAREELGLGMPGELLLFLDESDSRDPRRTWRSSVP